MENTEENGQIVDVRGLPPPARHSHIFKIFDQLKLGETLLVVNDHEPVHLVQFMKHERRDFDFSSYKAYQKGPAEWIGVFKKKKEDAAGITSGQPAFVFTSFDKEEIVDESAFSPVPVYTSKDYKVILAYFKEGQFIPVHSPSIDLILLVHSGRGEMIAGDQKFNVMPGDLVIVPRGNKRGIRALTAMQVLHLVSPPPTDKDHEEVAKKLSVSSFL
ncbi:MAG TPA: DUF2249 domain-containing protein [Nitrososphaerales archaeon]|nr:DUF2249 domain-containing protein [Nitrososphaerales archaeon]